ncbi:MAG: TIR domain-containing protein, partial [Verrucomicrobia bacterium]|nr:TIR domain-containing protein [Verrucomicrobiota bacterium]
MSEQDSKAEIFDVFLCHNSEDKPAVREIAQKLVREGIKPWLDVEQIRPGTTWQTALGEQIKNIKSAAVFVGNSGIGPWQSEEIQAFLGEFVDRKCPVIPTILASANATPELPWTLKNRHRVDFRVSDPDPLKQLIWGITGLRPKAEGPLIPGVEELGTSRKAYSQTRLYPPLAQRPDPEQAAQLEIFRRRVNEYWIDGVLKHSLYSDVLIALGKRQTDEFIHAPWKYSIEVADTAGSMAFESRSVPEIYDATGLLLILGEPGCGKTTTLLDLARILLDRAERDIKERVAIVLNLSSWKKKQPLADWIAVELSEKYRVPRKIASFWLQRDYLVPLLDGLDEVRSTLRTDCVTAINAFIEEFNPSGLVACCRLNEYRWLPERLKLNGAICLEPLSTEEVNKYLANGGPKLAALREAVNTDPVLHELAQTPLMLGIMSLACQGASGDELAREQGDSTEERRKQIFHLYAEQMFQRKGTNATMFPKGKTIGWLSWLSGKMKAQSQSVLLVEGVQPRLGTKAKRIAYATVVALTVGIIFGLSVGLGVGGPRAGMIFGLSGGLSVGLNVGLAIFLSVGLGCWSELPLKNGAISGAIGGLIYALIVWLRYGLRYAPAGGLSIGLISGLIGGFGVGSLNQITLVETMSWNWNQFWKRTIPGSIFGLIFGLMAGLSVGLIYGLIVGLRYGLIVGLSVGMVSGLIGGFTDRV